MSLLSFGSVELFLFTGTLSAKVHIFPLYFMTHVRDFFFFFFYVIYSLLRYKKSHGALAMAKTKPKSQNELTKETSGTLLFNWGP